jgi:23S rRNA (guanosine2251-2'-O)-methyltransferase
MSNKQTEILYGFHPVREAFKAGRRKIFKLYTIRARTSRRMASITALAANARVPVQIVAPSKLAALAQTDRHQGVCIEAGFYPVTSLQELVGRDAGPPSRIRLLLLDNLVDPRNLGALIRTACCAAMDGIIATKDRSASPTPAVSKASAGALEHVRLARVTNMVNTIKQLQSRGVWVVGLAREAEVSVFESDLTGPLALAIGGEAKGLRPLVQKTCDRLVSIPQTTTVDSLNASVAGAIAIYEIYRQTKDEGYAYARKN